MRILFSNPPWWAGIGRARNSQGQIFEAQLAGVRAGSRWPHTITVAGGPDRFQFGRYLPYPFFMGYAASYVAAKTGAQVVLRDSIALSESYQTYFRFLDENPFDYIFIESATPSWEHDSEILRILHQRYPQTKLVLTGPITSEGPKLMSEFPIHACIRGEYEKGSVKVISGAEGMIDFDLLTKEEMNAAPFPFFDEACAHRYWDANPVGQKAPHAQVWSSRGCPYKCIFCVWPATMTGNDPDGTRTRTVRHYSAEYMEAFLRELVGRFQYKSIYFDDDTFNLGNAHVERMCGVMSKIGLPWSAMCRADSIKMETWRMMKESGCFGVKLGFESGNQYVVDHIVNKHLDLERAKQVVYELKRLGMSVHGTFTIGLPGETAEQMEDTKRFIAGLPFDSYQLSGCAEIEGTPLHSLTEQGKLDKYQGAKLDENYHRHSDGNQKASAMLSGALTASAHQSRRLIFCDASLRDNKGHFANACRHIAGEARRRGLDTVVLSAKSIEAPLAQELNAQPHFSLPGWVTLSNDPVAGSLETFVALSDVTAIDLDRLQGLGASDVIYWNSAQAAELKAIIDWMQVRFTPATCPRIVVEFGYPSGLLKTTSADGNAVYAPINQQPQLYRFAIRRLKKEFRQRLVLTTFDKVSSQAYAELFGTEVITLPLPQRPEGATRLRSDDKAIIVSFIGHQRPDKGFHLVPEIVQQLLATRPNVRILVHNGAASEMLEETSRLIRMSENEPRLGVHHGPADGQLWNALLDMSSLTVLPYQPERYQNAYSAILAEALPRALPTVVPAGTTMARTIEENANCGVTFSEWTVPSVLAAIHTALDQFGPLAGRSFAAAQQWRAHHGPDKTLDVILGTKAEKIQSNAFVSLDRLLQSAKREPEKVLA